MIAPRRRRVPAGALRAVLRAAILALSGVAASGGADALAGATDWPHWRGPDRDGTSAERGLPVEWGSDRNVRWKLALPAISGATPIVTGDLVLLNVGDGDRLELWAVGAGDGKLR